MDIIHITIDEKFMNAAIQQFKLLDSKSYFYVLNKKKVSELRYIKKEENVFTLNPTFNNLKKFAGKLKNKIVVFHGFTFKSAYFLKNLKDKNNNTLVYIGWGAEFYSNTKLFKNQNLFLEKSTISLKEKLYPKLFLDKLNFKKLINRLKDNYVIKNLSKVNFIGVSYDEQREKITTKLKKEFIFFNFMYYPIEKMVSSIEDKVNGNNILIGNSASFTNNHSEIFELLKSNLTKTRKIYCPLSYGDINYASKIIDLGKTKYKENFYPLTDFMPLTDYNKIIKSCGIVIMNHKRQQAFGNIIVLLFFGAKVYLNEENSIYKFLKRKGFYVYSIKSDLNKQNSLMLHNLTINQQEHNKKLLIQDFNANKLKKELEDNFKRIAKFNEH